MRATRALLILSAALGLGGCGSLDVTPPTGLSVLLSVDNPVLALGATMHIVVTVTNAGKKAETLSGPSGCLVFVQILSQTSALVYSSTDTCTGDVTMVSMAPGESRTATIDWDGRSTAGSRLPAGQYALRGGVLQTGLARVGSSLLITIE
jgi:hypothetical protein